jgi:hypothetical protein
MSGETISGDLLWGVRAISDEIGQTERQVHYQLEHGLLPGGMQGGRWVASREVLREHFKQLTSQRKSA